MMPLMTLLKLSSPYTLLFVASVLGWVTALKKFKPMYLVYACIYGLVVFVGSWPFNLLSMFVIKIYQLFVFKGYLPVSLDEVYNLGPIAAGVYLAAAVFLIPFFFFLIFLGLYITYYYVPRYVLVRVIKEESPQEITRAIMNTIGNYLVFIALAILGVIIYTFYYGLRLK